MKAIHQDCPSLFPSPRRRQGAAFLALAFAAGGTLSATEPLRAVESEAAIEILRGDALVLRYHKQPPAEAAQQLPSLARSGFIHPLVTPSGRVVTDDLSPKHPHQHGLFFAWTKTRYRDREVEFWNEPIEKGKIRYAKTLAVLNEDDHAGFEVEHHWDDLTAPGGPETALVELWRVTARHEGTAYLIELESRQRCAGDAPLRVEQYHYGGMAVRGSAQWLESDETLMRTSEGLDRLDGNHTRPAWVQMSGLVDGAACGIRVTPDPGNFRHPQWARLHPNLPYFVFSPMIEEPFEIVPGEEHVSRFRIEVFDGETAPSISLPPESAQ